MVALALFAAGLIAGASALFVGGFVMLAAPLGLAIVSGVHDGWTQARIRLAWSWAPALLGSLLVPVGAIAKDQFRDPPAPDAGLALSVGLAFLATFAAAFVALALTTSAITRVARRRSAER